MEGNGPVKREDRLDQGNMKVLVWVQIMPAVIVLGGDSVVSAKWMDVICPVIEELSVHIHPLSLSKLQMYLWA